jgi:hypothetical protein
MLSFPTLYTLMPLSAFPFQVAPKYPVSNQMRDSGQIDAATIF